MAAEEQKEQTEEQPAEERPAEERPAEAQPAAEEAAPQEAEGVLPAGVGRARLPLIGEVPFALIGVLTGASALVFVGVLVLCISMFSRPAPAPEPGPAVAAEPEAQGPAAQSASPAPVTGLSYGDLMDRAEQSVRDGDLADAARMYRAAADCDEQGLNRVLLARHKLAQCLARGGKYEEALSICEGLAAVSRPGDELWKHAQIVAIDALGEEGQWPEFFRRMYLLRANSARYSDEGALNRWLSYCRAMAKVRVLLARLKDGGAIYGRRVPAFGRAPYAGRPLSADDIVVTAGKYGDGTLETSFTTGSLRLRSEGASVGQVLERVAGEAGLKVDYAGPSQYRVIAYLDASAPDYVLETALGSVGLQGRIEGDTLKVGLLQPVPRSEAAGFTDAVWALREFLILYPESTLVPEAYYALAHLYMTQGRVQMALDQFDVLCKEFPRSEWAVTGHYVAGRVYHGQGDWGRAEKELLLAADRSKDPTFVASAYLWAAHSQVELHKYEEAVNSFRRALADEVNEPLAPEILYSIAYCMDMSGDLSQEVEERYLEVRTRYPDSPYARLADYRLARRAFLADRYDKAVVRYEQYLHRWPLDDESSRDACRDLIVSYVRTGHSVRAVLLGETMVSSFSHEPQYWQALPTVLKACKESGLQDAALQIIERSLAAADTPERQWSLKVSKAECLIDLKEYDKAEALLTALTEEVKEPLTLEAARLAEARLWLEQPRSGPVREVCQEIATNSPSETNRAAALVLLGRYLEGTKDFTDASRAYAGLRPPDGDRSVQ